MDNEVVNLIMEYINEKGLKIGDKLPSTLSLAKEFDATPSQIRTSLINLASVGLMDIRPRSGSYIKALDIDIIERMFNIFLNQGLSDETPGLLNIYQFKTMVDSEIFSIAASVRSDTDLYQMKTIIEKQSKYIEIMEDFIKYDEELHGYVASISRNPLFVIIIDVLQGMLRPDRLDNKTNTIEKREQIIVEHENLFNAIKIKDEKLASELARKHCDRRRMELIAGI